MAASAGFTWILSAVSAAYTQSHSLQVRLGCQRDVTKLVALCQATDCLAIENWSAFNSKLQCLQGTCIKLAQGIQNHYVFTIKVIVWGGLEILDFISLPFTADVKQK